jgi:23S rRNA (guanine745-N1)-methyltransferase
VFLSPALNEQLLGLLRCPTCGSRLRAAEGALQCQQRHTFNLARQGYVSLLAGSRPTSGDDAAMVAARGRFLRTGCYEPVRVAVASRAAAAAPEVGTAVDVGCGTGYYLAGLLDRLPGFWGVGLDSSTPALRVAARVHERAAAASWDVFRPFPLASATADVVLDVFAPRNPAEFRRILRPDGRLVVARPTDRHLAELRHHVPMMVAVDPSKEERLRHALSPFFASVATDLVEYSAPLSSQQMQDLLDMTPTARHPGRVSPSANPSGSPITISILISEYQPR